MHLLKLYQAYGRANSLHEARQDFLSGKDFSVTKVGGPYTSIRDFVGPEENPGCKGYDGVILLAYDLARDKITHCVVTVDDMKEFNS